jgi:hypothetical protein
MELAVDRDLLCLRIRKCRKKPDNSNSQSTSGSRVMGMRSIATLCGIKEMPFVCFSNGIQSPFRAVVPNPLLYLVKRCLDRIRPNGGFRELEFVHDRRSFLRTYPMRENAVLTDDNEAHDIVWQNTQTPAYVMDVRLLSDDARVLAGASAHVSLIVNVPGWVDASVDVLLEVPIADSETMALLRLPLHVRRAYFCAIKGGRVVIPPRRSSTSATRGSNNNAHPHSSSTEPTSRLSRGRTSPAIEGAGSGQHQSM